MTKRGKRRPLAASGATPGGASTARAAAFWQSLDEYNCLPAPARAERLAALGILAPSADVLGLLTKSHFVIPGKTRFECQRCGECCRYARRVATLTYEPCVFLTDGNRCAKHDNHYLVCRWFPFYVHHDAHLGDLLTIKPYCTGYGVGPLVDSDAVIRRTNALERETRHEGDGAVVIHEVLLLPDRGEWFFPSRNNIDHLLRVLADGNQPTPSDRPRRHVGELNYAQHYTSGLLGGTREPQLTLDDQWRVTDVNEAFLSLCRRPIEHVIGVSLETLVTNPESLRRHLRQALAQGKLAGVPQRVAGPGGETLPVLVDAMTYRDRDDGLVHGLIVCMREVSAAVVNTMIQSQGYARGLLEASLDLLAFLDVDGTVLDVNEAAVRMTGRARDLLIGSDFAAHFSAPEEASRGVQRTLEAGQVQDFDLELLGAGGTPIPVQLNATIYRDPDGSPQGIFAAARDVSAQKKMVAELRAAQDYARGLIESGLDLMVTVARDGIITDVNSAACEMTGVPRAELVGADFVGFFADAARAQGGVERCFREGQVRNYELNLRHRQGGLIPVSFNATVYRAADGEVQGVFGIARDIRERLAMMRASEEARRYARSLIESCPDMMVAIDREGRVTDVNEATVRLAESTRDALVGSPFDVNFVDQERAREGVRQAYVEGVVSNLKLELLTSSGTHVPVSFNARLFRDTSGEVSGVIAIARTS